jgi:hypothetical protein
MMYGKDEVFRGVGRGVVKGMGSGLRKMGSGWLNS